MSRARTLLYTHCLVALACIGSAAFLLERSAEFGWRFDRRLEKIFADPVVSWACVALGLSSFAFPALVAYSTVGRMSAWRWCPIVAADFVLGVVQFIALQMVYPVRY